MCKYCKTCGKSDFGYTRKRMQTISDAVRVVNGDIVEVFEDSEETTSTEELVPNYCFTCNKEITEKDLVNDTICPVCGKKVDHLTDDGICDDCADEVAKLSKMSQNELILELLKQKNAGATKTRKRKITSKAKETEKIENNTQDNNKDNVLKEAENIVANKVEIDGNKTKAEEKVKVSKEPAPVAEEEVKQAEQENEAKVAGAVSESANANVDAKVDDKETLEDLNNVDKSTDSSIPANTVDSSVPEADIVDTTLDEINSILNDVSETAEQTVENDEEEINRDLF